MTLSKCLFSVLHHFFGFYSGSVNLFFVVSHTSQVHSIYLEAKGSIGFHFQFRVTFSMKACHNLQERLSAEPGNFVQRQNVRICSRTFEGPAWVVPRDSCSPILLGHPLRGCDIRTAPATAAQDHQSTPSGRRKAQNTAHRDITSPIDITDPSQFQIEKKRCYPARSQPQHQSRTARSAWSRSPSTTSANAVQVDTSWLDERDRHVLDRATPGATQARIESWPGRR